MKCTSIALAGCLALALSSCAAPLGLLYTHTYEPLTINFHRTQVQSVPEEGGVKTLQYYVRVDWGSNGLGDIAKEHGFDQVLYVDLETLIVLGIWRQEWAHVYGTRKAAPEPPAE